MGRRLGLLGGGCQGAFVLGCEADAPGKQVGQGSWPWASGRTSCPGRPGRTAGSSSSSSPGVGLQLVRPGPCSVRLSWGLEESSPCPPSPLTFPRMGQGLLHSIPPILQMEKRPQEEWWPGQEGRESRPPLLPC